MTWCKWYNILCIIDSHGNKISLRSVIVVDVSVQSACDLIKAYLRNSKFSYHKALSNERKASSLRANESMALTAIKLYYRIFFACGTFSLKWSSLISFLWFSSLTCCALLTSIAAQFLTPLRVLFVILISGADATHAHPQQDRQMIVFSIALFISPHNLWIIFQHFSTSDASFFKWIASNFP